jgi:3-hydroxyacyl-[acyl-carrier-protein] dehydratase
LDRLPHGPEFRFIDRLIELEPGKRGVGEYRVRGDEAFLRGHFPDEPMMPGVLLVEAVAQLAGVVAQSDPGVAPLPGLKLAALQAVRIIGTARPGEVLRIEAGVIGRLGNLVQAEGLVSVAGRVVLKAQVSLAGAAPRTNGATGLNATKAGA